MLEARRKVLTMNRRQFLTVFTLSLAGALGACGTASEQNQDMTQQFLTERNGGTPVAIGAGGPNAPILGSIETIDGRTLTVKRPIEGTTATIELADGAKIRKDVDAQLDELKAGDSVTAFGSRQGDVFQADLLRLAGDTGPDDSPMVMSFTNGDASKPSGGGQDQFTIGGPGSALPQPVSGTIETIDGRNIVLKDKSGASITVTLASSAKIQKPTEATLAELTIGTFIMASGAQSAGLFQATQVRIMPAPK
jgi:Domain of unknown function (DUF5666)